MKKFKIVFLVLFAIILFARAGFACALNVFPDGMTFPQLARYFFNFGIYIASSLALCAIAFGGIYYLVSYGRGSFTSEAQEWVKAGILGLFIILASYLIAYTINPDLVEFRLDGLKPVFFQEEPPVNPVDPNAKITIFRAVPVGLAVEKLLTNTDDCYDFDENGNPIEGDWTTIKTDEGEIKYRQPTYVKHDRVDCLIKLIDGAQKKADEAKRVADKIKEIMLGCSCAGAGSGSKDACCAKKIIEQIQQGDIEVKNNESSNTCAPDAETLIWYTLYLHMDKVSVEVGQKLTKGQEIGEIGDVGTDMGPHLHFAVGWPDPKNPLAPINLNIYSVISAPYGSVDTRHPGTSATKLPTEATPKKINFILGTLINPVDLCHCSWQEELRSAFHINNAYYAQDWICKNDPSGTESAVVYNMSGGLENIESEVIMAKSEITNGVLIKHTLKTPLSTHNSYSGGKTLTKIYKGLNEFRTDRTGSQIVDLVQKKKSNGKPVNANQYIVNNGECDICNPCVKCGTCSPGDKECLNNLKQCLTNREKCLQDYDKCQENRQKCTEAGAWDKLNVLEQLMWFKEMIAKTKPKIQEDLSALDATKNEIEKKQCYLTPSYIDFLKIFETTKQGNTNIILGASSQKKYCKGFNYTNSDCFAKCNNMCPDASADLLSAYKSCNETCNLGDCDEKDSACLKLCVQNYYNSRPCTFGPNTGANFKTCLASCQNNCLADCAVKYTECSDDYVFCQKSCQNNSSCIVNSEGSCLLSDNLTNCKDNVQEQENAQNCVNNAYYCNYGSDQYAGYLDCLKKQTNLSKPCDQFSSSFLYENPSCQRCPDPYAKVEIKDEDNENDEDEEDEEENPLSICSVLYPETSKCPASSDCPDCSCNSVRESFDIHLPPYLCKGPPCDCNEITMPKCSEIKTGDFTAKAITANGSICLGSEEDCPGKEKCSINIFGYQLVGPECIEYGYNDDPLTFYCQDEWWKDPNKEGTDPVPIGDEKICHKEDVIPVGQTIDNAKNWANDLFSIISENTNKVQEIISYLKRIGSTPKDEYCKCDSSCKNGNAICADKKNNPCQQMMNNLTDAVVYYAKIKVSYINSYLTNILEPRSDILKQLQYSREKTSDCSAVKNVYGNNETRLFNCTRVMHELMPPVNSGKIIFENEEINSYCYGKELGKLFDQQLTDDWFCCQEYQLGPTNRDEPP